MMSGNKQSARTTGKKNFLNLWERRYGPAELWIPGNVSIIDVLCGRHDIIVYGAECHAALLTDFVCMRVTDMCINTTTWQI